MVAEEERGGNLQRDSGVLHRDLDFKGHVHSAVGDIQGDGEAVSGGGNWRIDSQEASQAIVGDAHPGGRGGDGVD